MANEQVRADATGLRPIPLNETGSFCAPVGARFRRDLRSRGEAGTTGFVATRRSSGDRCGGIPHLNECDPLSGSENLSDRGLSDLAVVYDPSVPFVVHTTDGDVLDLRVGDAQRRAAAFRPADEALGEYVIVDFGAFDEWYEEDERNFAHPRDPFHRIEIVHSSRSVRVELDGELLAASTRRTQSDPV